MGEWARAAKRVLVGNLYLLHDGVRCMFTLCVPSNHGSQFPDVDSFADFAHFVSDMSRKGNQPVDIHVTNVRLRSKKDGVLTRNNVPFETLWPVVARSYVADLASIVFFLFCLSALLVYFYVQVKKPVICANYHVFCSSCMEMWLKKTSQCPTCRVPITTDNPCREIIGEHFRMHTKHWDIICVYLCTVH